MVAGIEMIAHDAILVLGALTAMMVGAGFIVSGLIISSSAMSKESLKQVLIMIFLGVSVFMSGLLCIFTGLEALIR